MSIKSDKWIHRMCEQHGMIEPFESNQVKQVDGKKIVSYGAWRRCCSSRATKSARPPNLGGKYQGQHGVTLPKM